MKSKKGFTMIEILVTISLVGLLAVIVLASVGTARAKARDAKRISELQQLQKALELYFDRHEYYPASPRICTIDDSYSGDCGGVGNSTDWHAASDLRALVAEGYVSELPKDPVDAGKYFYRYRSILPGETIPAVLKASACSGNAAEPCFYYLATRLESRPNVICADAGFSSTPPGCLNPPSTGQGDWGYVLSAVR